MHTALDCYQIWLWHGAVGIGACVPPLVVDLGAGGRFTRLACRRAERHPFADRLGGIVWRKHACSVLRLARKLNTSDVAEFSERRSLFEDHDVRHRTSLIEFGEGCRWVEKPHIPVALSPARTGGLVSIPNIILRTRLLQRKDRSSVVWLGTRLLLYR